MALQLTEESSVKMFEGYQKFYSHHSQVLNCKMSLGVYLPEEATLKQCPVIYYLSGKLADEQTCSVKAGAQRLASHYKIIFVTPDTRPRELNLEEKSKGLLDMNALYYVDATEEPWSNHCRMYSYIVEELPSLMRTNFNVLPGIQSIMGHSMGGHGALLCGLKKKGFYATISAFAPVCNIIKCMPAATTYRHFLGDETKWHQWLLAPLIRSYDGPPLDILLHQGTDDNRIDLLSPEDIIEACKKSPKIDLTLKIKRGYDHNYPFVSTFIEEHFKHHVKYLFINKQPTAISSDE